MAAARHRSGDGADGMSTATETRPSLRAVILDALEDAYWYRKGEVEDCLDCRKQPAGVCGAHEADGALARDYEEARKQLERSPGDPDVLAVFCGIEAAAMVRGANGGN
jgi:hypothetical protein